MFLGVLRGPTLCTDALDHFACSHLESALVFSGMRSMDINSPGTLAGARMQGPEAVCMC